MQEIVDALKRAGLQDVFFGPNGFSMADETTIEDLQLGYSIHPDGTGLTGCGDGDWQESWVVIGTDTELGDPFFVDTSSALLPVYTAMHGMGAWEPELVAQSLSSFLAALSYLNNVSKQGSALIYPNEATVTAPKELSEIAAALSELSGEDRYWNNFIESHKEWAAESGS